MPTIYMLFGAQICVHFLDKYIKIMLLVQSVCVCSVFVNTAEQFSWEDCSFSVHQLSVRVPVKNI